MKTPLILSLFLVASVYGADVHAFGWQESRDEKTGEKHFGFFVAAPKLVRDMFVAEAKGDSKAASAIGARLPKDAWDYALLLTGESTSYSKEKVAMVVPSPCGDVIKIVSGTVEVDRKKNAVRIALQVVQDGKTVDFVGNGSFTLEKLPN
jgi:hypothetical protein